MIYISYGFLHSKDDIEISEKLSVIRRCGMSGKLRIMSKKWMLIKISVSSVNIYRTLYSCFYLIKLWKAIVCWFILCYVPYCTESSDFVISVLCNVSDNVEKITNLADAHRMSVEESEALKLENSSLKKELADASTSDVYRSCKEESDALKVENFRLKKELGEAYIRHLQP